MLFLVPYQWHSLTLRIRMGMEDITLSNYGRMYLPVHGFSIACVMYHFEKISHVIK